MDHHVMPLTSGTPDPQHSPVYHRTHAPGSQISQWSPMTEIGDTVPNGYSQVAPNAKHLSAGYNASARQQPTPEPSFQIKSSVWQGHTPMPNSQHVAVQSMIHPESHISQNVAFPSLPLPQMDHATILLTLAEEYLVAAYGLVASSNARRDATILKQYYRLVAIALGCMETVLEKCNLDPQKEVMVRLRYATILFDETENSMEAEENLSKAISIADRHKLLDLRYNAQHILVRMLFTTRPSAAFKYLDRILADLEAYEHFDWVYAFGLLKVSLHMQGSPSRNDASSSISMLTKLMALAENLGDTAILATAATQKAWICLRTSITNDSLEEAQTSLAVARRLQGTRASLDLLPVIIMIAIVDLCCCLRQSEPEQALLKLRHLEDNLLALQSNTSWLGDGTFHVPLRARTPSSSSLPGSVIQKFGGTSSKLMISWLSKGDVSTIAHLLSCFTNYHQPKSNPRKAEEILQRALQRQASDQSDSDRLRLPLSFVMSAHLLRQRHSLYIQLILGFIHCTRSNWPSATDYLSNCRAMASHWHSTPKTLQCTSDLLAATIAQATGDLDGATAAYENLFQQGKNLQTSGGNLINDVTLLAILNYLLVVGLPDTGNVRHKTASDMVSLISKEGPIHPNRQIQAAYHLVQSTLLQVTTIIGQKQTLQLALNAAKASHSSLALCMALVIMYHYFFRDQVTEQAEKSARAAHNMARRVNNKIWTSATAKIMAGHFEAMARQDEAENALKEGWEASRSFPPNIQRYLGWYDANDTNVEMSFV